jgi:hypothetical protein
MDYYTKRKIKKEDSMLLSLLKKDEKKTVIKHNYINIPVNRKRIGLTKEERNKLDGLCNSDNLLNNSNND